MGVVRDITIDQLTQAVTGISTNGMSDTTGQAINSTLGTLGKDTSLQDIKTAINALANSISPAASNVSFDNTGTDLTSSNVEGAIKEVAGDIDVSSLVTISSGLTVVRKLAIKRNNIIMIDICVRGTVANTATLATLDNAIRPRNTNIRVLGNVANNITGFSISDGCLWMFAANGIIQYYGPTQTNAELVFSLMYII